MTKEETIDSKIATAVGAKYEPVAIILTDLKPEGARQFKDDGLFSWFEKLIQKAVFQLA